MEKEVTFCEPSQIIAEPVEELDCITLCNVAVKKERTCRSEEEIICCLETCNDFPIVRIDDCRACFIDSCCEVKEDSSITGLKTADVSATFQISVLVQTEAPSGELCPAVCTRNITVDIPDVFESCEIKNCRVVEARADCRADRFEGCEIFVFVEVEIRTEACVLENEVKVARCLFG
ncbi:hypothetical protein ACSVDA_21560 [Cytobacillus sp. Hm23]